MDRVTVSILTARGLDLRLQGPKAWYAPPRLLANGPLEVSCGWQWISMLYCPPPTRRHGMRRRGKRARRGREQASLQERLQTANGQLPCSVKKSDTIRLTDSHPHPPHNTLPPTLRRRARTSLSHRTPPLPCPTSGPGCRRRPAIPRSSSHQRARAMGGTIRATKSDL